jgi:hypothetical protein
MTLVYYHQAGGAYVTLVGRATITDEVVDKQAIWQPGSFKWHPRGPTDPCGACRVCGRAHRNLEHAWADCSRSYHGLMGRRANSQRQRLALRLHDPRSIVQSKIIGVNQDQSTRHCCRYSRQNVSRNGPNSAGQRSRPLTRDLTRPAAALLIRARS